MSVKDDPNIEPTFEDFYGLVGAVRFDGLKARVLDYANSVNHQDRLVFDDKNDGIGTFNQVEIPAAVPRLRPTIYTRRAVYKARGRFCSGRK